MAYSAIHIAALAILGSVLFAGKIAHLGTLISEYPAISLVVTAEAEDTLFGTKDFAIDRILKDANSPDSCITLSAITDTMQLDVVSAVLIASTE